MSQTTFDDLTDLEVDALRAWAYDVLMGRHVSGTSLMWLRAFVRARMKLSADMDETTLAKKVLDILGR